jgi:zinc/manganese transport system substrate-binding protein/manganese/iron transport system substrate-binding protein
MMKLHGARLVARLAIAVAVALLVSAPTTTSAQEATPTPLLAPLPDIPAPEGDPLRVVTTTTLLADLVRQIGGGRVDVESLLTSGADPHDFEPEPKQIVAVEEADLVVIHGLGLDRWVEELIESAGTEAPVLIATAGVPTIASSEEGFDEGDPHVWLDPRNVQIMTANIAAELARIDLDGAAAFAARAEAYRTQLEALDGWIAERIATIPPERRKVVTSHASLGYYLQRYGLAFVGAVIPSLDTRAEPSARDLAALIERIEAEHVPAIFAEVSIDPRLEEEIAAQANVAIVTNLYADSLGEPGGGADSYIGMMVHNTNLIVAALA